jgi:hypothetical protein
MTTGPSLRHQANSGQSNLHGRTVPTVSLNCQQYSMQKGRKRAKLPFSSFEIRSNMCSAVFFLVKHFPLPLISDHCKCMYKAMRPKARGLTLHGGPPGWLEESEPTGCDFVCDGRSLPPALTDHTTGPGLGQIFYLMYTKHRHELRHTKKAWPGILVGLLFGIQCVAAGGV